MARERRNYGALYQMECTRKQWAIVSAVLHATAPMAFGIADLPGISGGEHESGLVIRGGLDVKRIFQLTEPDGNIIDTMAMTPDEASLRNDDQAVINEEARWLRSEGDNIFKSGKSRQTDPAFT